MTTRISRQHYNLKLANMATRILAGALASNHLFVADDAISLARSIMHRCEIVPTDQKPKDVKDQVNELFELTVK